MFEYGEFLKWLLDFGVSMIPMFTLIAFLYMIVLIETVVKKRTLKARQAHIVKEHHDRH